MCVAVVLIIKPFSFCRCRHRLGRLGLGQTSNFLRYEPNLLVSWIHEKFQVWLSHLRLNEFWIVQHVLSVCFRRIKGLKIVSGTHVDLQMQRTKLIKNLQTLFNSDQSEFPTLVWITYKKWRRRGYQLLQSIKLSLIPIGAWKTLWITAKKKELP